MLEVEQKQLAEKIESLRVKRNKLLRNSDWVFLPDVKLENNARKYYKEYRQYLRDLPKKNTQAKTLEEFSFLSFEEWLRFSFPQEFLDGGKHEMLIKHLMAHQE